MVARDQRDELNGKARIPGNCLHKINEGAPRQIGLGIELPVISAVAPSANTIGTLKGCRRS